MWRYLIPVGLFAVLGVFFWRGLNLSPGYVPSPLLGKPMPTFSVAQLEDADALLTSDQLHGQVALFNVWATWCSGCRAEHPFLLELSRSSGVPIYGLDWKDDRSSAKRWLATLGDPYVVSGFDDEGNIAIDWGVYGAPETFLIGRDGTVLYKHIAPLTPEAWQKEFVPRIKEACGDLPCAGLGSEG